MVNRTATVTGGHNRHPSSQARAHASEDTTPVTARRFPRQVYEVGAEPDPRFTLANERTFLAWIRTALALIAGGVALEALALPIQPTLRRSASIILLLFDLAVPLLAWVIWGAVGRALRQGRPLPGSKVALPVAAGVSLAGVLILLGTVLH
jgi:putative membrane protein